VLDYAENVSVGQRQWREFYVAHGEQKRAQIEKMIRFADTNQCRMSTLVRHFGDLADGQTVCGICDFCPSCPVRIFRSPVSNARHIARSVRICRTTRSCTVRSKGYEAYQDGAAAEDD
jgi:superfamily II DNA helicase RecQ